MYLPYADDTITGDFYANPGIATTPSVVLIPPAIPPALPVVAPMACGGGNCLPGGVVGGPTPGAATMPPATGAPGQSASTIAGGVPPSLADRITVKSVGPGRFDDVPWWGWVLIVLGGIVVVRVVVR